MFHRVKNFYKFAGGNYHANKTINIKSYIFIIININGPAFADPLHKTIFIVIPQIS